MVVVKGGGGVKTTDGGSSFCLYHRVETKSCFEWGLCLYPVIETKTGANSVCFDPSPLFNNRPHYTTFPPQVWFLLESEKSRRGSHGSWKGFLWNFEGFALDIERFKKDLRGHWRVLYDVEALDPRLLL